MQKYSECSQGELEVVNKDEPVRDSLVQGLQCSMTTNPASRTMGPLVAMLQHCTPLNQKEVTGLFKALSSTNASIGRANADLLLVEAMKYIVRVGQQESMKHDISVMRPLFDPSLARQYLRLKKAGVQVLTWLQTHMDLAIMLLDKSDLEAVMGAKGGWGTVGPRSLD